MAIKMGSPISQSSRAWASLSVNCHSQDTSFLWDGGFLSLRWGYSQRILKPVDKVVWKRGIIHLQISLRNNELRLVCPEQINEIPVDMWFYCNSLFLAALFLSYVNFDFKMKGLHWLGVMYSDPQCPRRKSL